MRGYDRQGNSTHHDESAHPGIVAAVRFLLQIGFMRANHWIGAAITCACLGFATPDAHAGLKVTFTTSATTPAGQFAPNHVVAVWVETQAGAFVKTIGRWSAVRTQSLQTWIGKAGTADADAVSGATQATQPNNLVTMEWDLKDRQGQVIPDGTYTIRLELADFNVGGGTPNLGTFTFVKGPSPQNQTALTNGGYSNVSIEFAPPPVATCGNGVADTGETCDPMITTGNGVCVDACVASADACAPNLLTGSSATCDAACEVVEITACANGDGCCADGCTAASDDDCAAASGSNLSGGCSTTGNEGLVLAGLGLAVVLGRRRRVTPA